VSSVSVASETSLRIIRMYEESGIKTKVAGIWDLLTHLRFLKFFRIEFGRLHDAFTPARLNMQTYTCYTFLLSIIGLVGAVVMFILECLPALVPTFRSLNLYFKMETS